MEKKISHDEIGFIGLGIMGKPMILNLLKAGYSIRFFARRKSVANSVKKKGGIECDAISSLTSACKIIFLNLTDDRAIKEVIFGKDKIFDNITQGSILIDMSTISPRTSQEIAHRLKSKKSYILDCPVSGGEIGAISAELSIMVGGNEKIYKKIKPLLDCLGSKVTYVGKSGSGQITKACNQILVAQTIIAVSEIIYLAKEAKTDPVLVQKALMGGFAYSKILDIHGTRIINEQYSPGFKSKLHLKDINIAMNLCNDYRLSLGGAKYARKILKKVIEVGYGEQDSSIMSKIVKNLIK
tara:strand:+ start:1754 stop:2644 length:891 start_codon:yes stop_codon:yes gene_type:complete